MPVDADSLGSYLRRERELQHVSLQDISAATKIQLRFLTDIENDAYDQLPPVPFVVGFLRAYAQCLALDPEEIVTLYHTHYGTPDELESQRFAERVRPARSSRRSGWKRLSLILGVAVLALASIWRVTRDRQDVASVPPVVSKAVEQVAKASLAASSQPRLPVQMSHVRLTEAGSDAGMEAVPTPVVPTQEPTASLQDDVQMPATPEADEPVASVADADGAGRHLSELESEPAGFESLSSATPPAVQHRASASSSSLMLQVMALEDTWLRVEIDGEQRHTVLLVAGKNIEWEADERFMLTVGNAHGTRLLLNGRDVPLPLTRNNVVRDFVLTRNMVN